MAPLRVLIIFGSESGATKVVAEKMAQSWADKALPNVQVESRPVTGNDAAGEFADLRAKYDVLLIATSSFGEGDPPDNYAKFLLALLNGASAPEKPLAGMQHAVLGFGDSNYDTFMNCPRLSDKLLEECGSRRLHKRYEIDGGVWEDGAADAMRKLEVEWQEKVLQALQAGAKPTDPPAAEWCEPGKTDKIFPKSATDLGGGGGGFGAVIALAVVTFGVSALYYFTQM